MSDQLQFNFGVNMETAKIKDVSEIEIGDRLIMQPSYTDSGFEGGSKFTVISEQRGWLKLEADTPLPSNHPDYVISGIEYNKNTFNPEDFEKILR